jgi:small subunit ribosomal protein S1
MKAYEGDLEKSFKVLNEGDIIDVTVVGVSDTEVTVDLNYYTEGIIPLEECSTDPAFSIKNDINIGDVLRAMVIEPEAQNGSIILSLKKANDILVWDELKKDYEENHVFTVKITEAVKGGAVCYVRGVRAFIPASHLAVEYVEDTSSYAGKTLEAKLITVDKEEHRVVLSAKAIAQEKALAEKNAKIGRLTPGTVLKGKIERMESYGVFVDIGEGLTGLCHISQITNRFIKSPKEVVQVGDEVDVKILKIDGDRISLSMKALIEENEAAEEKAEEESWKQYQSDSSEGFGSPFAALLKDIKL